MPLDWIDVTGLSFNPRENKEYKRKRGYTEGISVRRPWRRRGLARSLLVQSMKTFKEMGMTETALGVDSQNPSGSLNLYKSGGYKVVKQHTIYRKPIAWLPATTRVGRIYKFDYNSRKRRKLYQVIL